jgi:TPR repeat protein
MTMNSIADKKLEKDAITGDAEAQYKLGVHYYNRETGTPAYKYRSRADTAKALKWFRKAAEQGHAKAQCVLGYYCCRDANFGFLAHVSFFFVERNEIEGVKWFRKAAVQNYAEGQNNLGNCYANGQGVERDEVEAVKWYRKAAEQNYDYAQKNLGCCYRDGQGVTKDIVEACKWFSLAGFVAREELREIERTMTPEQIAEAQRLSREFQPHKESASGNSN